MSYLDWSHIWSITLAILLAWGIQAAFRAARGKIAARKTARAEAG